MTAEIIILPVTRADATARRRRRAPVTDLLASVEMEISLQRAIMNKLCAAASTADSSVESMAEALIVWGLAAIEHMSVEEFYTVLKL